jgi:CheY-like chemotaxis protein
MLTELSYRVVEATHGEAAIETLGDGTPIDMVLTDVVMPGGMDGWEMAQKIWRERPAFPILFVTGYTDNVILQRAAMDNRVRVLSKPFRQHDLANALRRSLAS